mgnify:CR=1 FL=1
MYKKASLFVLSVVLLLFMAACGKTESNPNKTGNSNAPVIESIAQKSGTGGDVVDININYDASKYGRDDVNVLIDGVKAELTTKYLSGKQFEFALPLNLEAGKKAIAVELGGKKSNEVEYEILTPEIASVNLSEISFVYMSEATLEISGSNLGFSADKVKVTLSGQELKVDAVSKSSIKVIVQKGVSSGNLVISINGKEMKTFPITIKES